MQISNAMENTQNTIHQLNLSAQAMDRIKEDILETLQNLAAIAEENSASTEEVTASMEEQAASIEEIASSSEGLGGFGPRVTSACGKVQDIDINISIKAVVFPLLFLFRL